MVLSCSISDSTSAAQSSSLSFALSKSPFQFSQSSVSEMFSGALASSLPTGWRLILRIWRTLNICICPPGRSFADRDGGKGDHSDNLSAAAPSCWKSEQDALKISVVTEMYSTAVIGLFWARDSFWVAHRFWLPCQITKKSWTLAILCNFHSSICFFISESFSVFVVPNSGSAPANILLLAQAFRLTTTSSWTVSPVVFDCLQPMTYQPREKLDSTPTPCGMRENMLRTRSESSVDFECVASCQDHQLVTSGNQHVLLIYNRSEWHSLRFGSLCPQFVAASGAGFEFVLAAVNWRATESLRPGVISATFLAVKDSSSSLDKSYGSKDDWQDLEAIAYRMRLLLRKHSCVLTGTRWCSAQYSFSTFFRKASWDWLVDDDLSSWLMSIALSHVSNDCNIRKRSRICAEIRCIPIFGVTSALYLESLCGANFTAKNKSSFHWVFFLAKACLTPSI